MNRTYACLLAACLVFVAQLLAAQQPDSVSARWRLKLFPVPAVGYAPETSTYFGGVVLGTLTPPDTATRPSSVKAEVNYSLKKQRIFEVGWDVFSLGERYRSQGLLSFSQFPDLYYGIGSEAPDSAEQRYSSNRTLVALSFYRARGKGAFLGGRFRMGRYGKVEAERPEASLRPGRYIGMGLVGLHDTRNSPFTPSAGHYAEGYVGYNHAPGGGYLQAILDGRAYRAFGKGHVLAFRLLQEALVGGEVPFFDLALMGGDRKARGIYYGRYRDRFLTAGQLAGRLRVVGRLGVAVFGGWSAVYAGPAAFARNPVGRVNYGAGLRFRIDDSGPINLRLDIAHSPGSPMAFYVAFGEAF